jgi:hypothetical protein
MVARRAHNPKVAGSSPAPATKKDKGFGVSSKPFLLFYLLVFYQLIDNKAYIEYIINVEVLRRLVGLLVFKTSAPVTSWWVGSIPMHFRYSFLTNGFQGILILKTSRPTRRSTISI